MSSPLSLDYGATVFYQGKRHVIRQETQDFRTVILTDPESGNLVEAAIVDLGPAEASPATSQKDLNSFNEEQLAEYEHKYESIKPLLDKPERTLDDVMVCADKAGVHFTTIYSWLRMFETNGKLSSFARRERSDKGKTTLPAATEKILADTIEALGLNKQKLNAAKISREVDRLCKKAGLKPPHPNTIRKRVKVIDPYRKLKAREGAKAARDELAPIKGHFPGADFPLAVTQVDHTPVDLVLVDDIHRQPIGRPWLTLLIDVHSRMVLGFYISFDPPGNLSLGLCLAQAFLPKEKWLSKFGIETAWPCWGLPRTIHADNAKEFRGNMLKKACKEYGVGLEWRPVATPHYGAHIERLLGTLNAEIHALSGTTFSNTTERGEYDSDAESTMSLAEFERWFTTLCVEVYHQRKHSELGMPPVAKWEEGIFGTKNRAGTGVPPRITDEQRLKLDLMPFETRTVQQYGIVWDHIEYQHDVLRRWINAPDPDNPKLKRKFLCRRDPRDISIIWFYDPEVHQYYAVPYRNTAHPTISVWELRQAEKRLAEERPDYPVDENLIFEAYDKMQRIEEDAKKLTRKARRNQERKRLGLANARSHVTRKASPPMPASPASTPPREIKPFDVDEMDGSDD